MHQVTGSPQAARAAQPRAGGTPTAAQQKTAIRTGAAADAAMAATQKQKAVTSAVNSQVPWPAIIMALIAIVALVFVGLIPRLSMTYRIIAIIMVLVWSILWIIVLWALWRYGQRTLAWILLLLPIISLVGYVLFMGLYYASK